MMASYWCSVVSLGVLTCLSLASASAEPIKSDYDFTPVTEKIQSWIDKGYYPGAALVIAQDRRVIYENYFGTNTPQTVTYIASSGKWLAAATIAAVVDSGKLSWDDRVSKWLPEFTDAKGKATLRQLLSHTAGYPDYQPKENPTDNYQTLPESVVHIVPLPPNFDPGTHFQYGGLAMQVAGRMAERATGKDWEALFQEKIAAPLHMTATHFTPVNTDGGHSPMLGGGARSTLHDYANFLEMIDRDGVFDGHRILSKKAIHEMQSDQVLHAKVMPNEFVEKARGNIHNGIYGLGEWREVLNAKGEAVQISSPSWAGAYPWIDKTRHIYGFFLAHVDTTNGAAAKDGFSSFYGSPVLATMVGEVIDAKKGK